LALSSNPFMARTVTAPLCFEAFPCFEVLRALSLGAPNVQHQHRELMREEQLVFLDAR
jgi:hypothetical protein